MGQLAEEPLPTGGRGLHASPAHGLALFTLGTIGVLFLGCGDSSRKTASNAPATAARQPSPLDALKAAAEGGNPDAQLALAKRFASGDGVEQDETKAFNWNLKAAQNGQTSALLPVARAYLEGKGTVRDHQAAKPWLEKAAALGEPEAQFLLAKSVALLAPDEVLIWAGKGESAQLNADVFRKWMSSAAAKGHLPAKHAWGVAQLLGVTDLAPPPAKRLIPQDIKAGFALLKEAADAGYWESIWAVAVVLQGGYGPIARNGDESNKYWAILGDEKDANVQRGIASIYDVSDPKPYKRKRYKGRELNFDETNAVAFEWYTKAAAQGDPSAMYSLGVMYSSGRGTWKNQERAIGYWKQAADEGNFLAQRDLAFSYLQGTGVARDYAEGFKWLQMAAKQSAYDAPRTRNALGALYENGWGTKKDLLLAYAWYNIAAAGQYEKSKANLSRVEKALAPEELREAQALSSSWKPGELIVRAKSGATGAASDAITRDGASKSPRLVSQGTGFRVSSAGDILTNQHVIEGCAEIRIPADSATARLTVADPNNDLALLRTEVQGKAYATFPNSDELRQGEDIFVFGFPLEGYLPSAGNITPGIVSALAGPGNNSSLVQITAPVQLGNSGGPLLNTKGRVVGVIVGKADALKLANFTGDVPQNINFAIAPKTVRAFLLGNNVGIQTRGDLLSLKKDSVGVAAEAREVTVKIECWR